MCKRTGTLFHIVEEIFDKFNGKEEKIMYEKFERLLEKSHKTAYRVAKDTGISSKTLYAWKDGEYTPKIDKIKKLAEYFGVDVSYFYEGG